MFVEDHRLWISLILDVLQASEVSPNLSILFSTLFSKNFSLLTLLQCEEPAFINVEDNIQLWNCINCIGYGVTYQKERNASESFSQL